MSDHLSDSVRYLINSLNVNGREVRLLKLLAKLNIKAAQKRYSALGHGAPLSVESLDLVMDAVSFDDKNLKLHKAVKK